MAKKTHAPQDTPAPEEQQSPDTGEPTAAQDAAGAETEETTETAEEAVSQKDLDALQDKYVRLMAEYDNYRKRTERDFTRLVETANEKLMLDILPILDNLDRATEHRKNKTSIEEYVKGISLIEDQLRQVLSRAGLEPMQVVGEPFDPANHDAIMQIDSDEYESGHVTTEVEKGYTLSGKVIRHPKVVVSK